MAVTAAEKLSSRSVTEGLNASAELRYVIRGAADEAAALTKLGTTAPATYTTTGGIVLSRTDCSVEPTDSASIWEGRATYGRSATAESFDFSFDVGATTAHLTQSIKTISKTPCKDVPAAIDNFGAIGVSQQNGSYSVAGVDVTVPTYTWQETHRIAGALVTQAYKLALFALVGKVNDAAFGGFAVGEVLFMGASGKMRDDGDWDITFRFAASLNVANVCADWPAAVKPTAVVPKKGWEYFWVRYEDAVDANTITKKPTSVYVEQVYRTGDYGTLTPVAPPPPEP